VLFQSVNYFYRIADPLHYLAVCSLAIANKMLSYRRETELQGGLVLAKSGRLKLGDNIFRTLQVYLQPL